jgi:hypothetical protein
VAGARESPPPSLLFSSAYPLRESTRLVSAAVLLHIPKLTVCVRGLRTCLAGVAGAAGKGRSRVRHFAGAFLFPVVKRAARGHDHGRA